MPAPVVNTTGLPFLATPLAPQVQGQGQMHAHHTNLTPPRTQTPQPTTSPTGETTTTSTGTRTRTVAHRVASTRPRPQGGPGTRPRPPHAHRRSLTLYPPPIFRSQPPRPASPPADPQRPGVREYSMWKEHAVEDTAVGLGRLWKWALDMEALDPDTDADDHFFDALMGVLRKGNLPYMEYTEEAEKRD